MELRKCLFYTENLANISLLFPMCTYVMVYNT